MRKQRIGIVSLVLAVCLLSSALAVIMYQKSITNNMTLNADYTINVFEHSTTTQCLSIAWGGFNESETKTYLIDLVYLGNVQGRIYWDGAVPSGWTLTLQEKNHDGTGYNAWLSGENNQITGLEYGHLKNVMLTLGETTAITGQQYAFTVTFYSLG